MARTRAKPSASWEGHQSKRVNPRYRKGAESGPTGTDEGSRSCAQYRGAGIHSCPEAWGTEAQGTHDKRRQAAGRPGQVGRRCPGKAGGTLSPLTVSTQRARNATKSWHPRGCWEGQQQSCRLRSRKLQVLGPQGPLLTNRMTEWVTYGSVGGVGRKPGPYPAGNAGIVSWLAIGYHWPGVPEKL